MTHDSFADGVETTLLALENGCDQCEHILINQVLLLHSVDILHTLLDDLGYLLRGVPINQHDPLVDEELLGSEFDINRFQHFDRLYDPGLHRVLQFVPIGLNQQQK
jgi:hypothetical protein